MLDGYLIMVFQSSISSQFTRHQTECAPFGISCALGKIESNCSYSYFGMVVEYLCFIVILSFNMPSKWRYWWKSCSIFWTQWVQTSKSVAFLFFSVLIVPMCLMFVFIFPLYGCRGPHEVEPLPVLFQRGISRVCGNGWLLPIWSSAHHPSISGWTEGLRMFLWSCTWQFRSDV